MTMGWCCVEGAGDPVEMSRLGSGGFLVQRVRSVVFVGLGGMVWMNRECGALRMVYVGEDGLLLALSHSLW